MMTHPATLSLQSDPAQVVEIQLRLSELAIASGLDGLAAFQFTTAIVEAVNNCIEHAYGGDPGHPISLRWSVEGGAVAVEIRDRGAPMEGVPAPSPWSTEKDLFTLSGRGWSIILEWADSADYRRESEENVLTLTRRL